MFVGTVSAPLVLRRVLHESARPAKKTVSVSSLLSTLWVLCDAARKVAARRRERTAREHQRANYGVPHAQNHYRLRQHNNEGARQLGYLRRERDFPFRNVRAQGLAGLSATAAGRREKRPVRF